ncbi:hypothetical protein ES703_114141 [subsurface metagenome]
MIKNIIQEIRTYLKNNSAHLTVEQKSRMYKILNSDNPNFVAYGNKHSNIEKFIRELNSKFQLNFDTWAITDTTMIRVIGPFLGKKGNEELTKKTLAAWSKFDNLWIRRASLVILLKFIMIKKEFDKDYVFEFVEKMVRYPEDYIHKGIGWLLKMVQ